jgi:phospholipase D1/2
MGFDSECDVAIEAAPGAPDADEVRTVITGLRNSLVAEHLGVARHDLEGALRDNTLLGAIRAMSGDGRTLRRFTAETIAGEAGPLAENELMDPDRAPESLAKSVQRFLTGFTE